MSPGFLRRTNSEGVRREAQERTRAVATENDSKSSNRIDANKVGVGIMIAHNPLHGSGQAALPHPALALGDDAHAAQGIGMTDGRRRQPASDEAPHAVPQDASVLAAPRQRAIPEAPDLEPKEKQRRLVQGHSVVAD